MKKDKQTILTTFLDELKLYAPGGFEIDGDCSHENIDGGQDVFIRLKDKNDIVGVARLVDKYGGRLVTLTPYVLEDGDELAYHFDVGKMIITFIVHTDDKSVPAITPVLKSADWTEREMKDLFSITPEGHPCPERLILDESIAQGAFEEYMSLSDAMAGAATNKLWEHINENKGGGNGEVV